MKKIIFLLSLFFSFIATKAQINVYADEINANKLIGLPVYDTLAAPKKTGELRVRPQDTLMYRYNGRLTGKRWDVLDLSKVTASNGLTKTNNNITLGGTLTQFTTINAKHNSSTNFILDSQYYVSLRTIGYKIDMPPSGSIMIVGKKDGTVGFLTSNVANYSRIFAPGHEVTTMATGVYLNVQDSLNIVGTGLTSSSDSSIIKPLGVNSNGKVVKMSYWPGGGGGGGGSGTLTSFSFIDGGGFTGTVNNPTTTPSLSLVLQDAQANSIVKGQATFRDLEFNDDGNGLIFLDTTYIHSTVYNDTRYLQNITAYITPGTNVTITGSGTLISPYVINSTSSGSTNSNIGSGYRWAVPGTNNIKTVFATLGLTIDSTSNSNALTLKADTAFLATLFDVGLVNNALSRSGDTTQLGGDLIKLTTITATAPENRIIFSGSSTFFEGPLLEVSTTGSTGIAVSGSTTDGRGIFGVATTGIGVYGTATGNGGYGLFGFSTNGNAAYLQSSAGVAIEAVTQSSSTNVIVPIASWDATSTGSTANGFGSSFDMYLKTSAGEQLSNRLIWKYTNATDASRTSSWEFWNINNAVMGRKLLIAGNGQLTLDGYPSLTQQTDTTNIKPLGYNTSTGLVQPMSNWVGTGGGGGGGSSDSTVVYAPLVVFPGAGSIPDTIGITGLTTIGTAGQSIRINAGATGFEYYTPSSGWSIATASGTGNYTISGNNFIILSDLTGQANRNVVLPTSPASGDVLLIYNKDASGFNWTFTNGTVKDIANNTITTVSDLTNYSMVFDGTNWLIIN